MRLLIIGGGPGGYVAALKASQLGARVAVVERSEVGGTCLHWGCIPTKTLIASVEVLNKARTCGDYGIDLQGSLSPNLTKIMERKSRVIATQVKGIRGLFKSWGVDLIEGEGILSGPRKVDVKRTDGTRESIEADTIIIATGSRPAPLSSVAFDGRNVLSSDEALNISEIPKSILIVGAGVIGCEFACIFNGLGAEVTLVEVLQRPVATEDTEISDQLSREFKKKGIRLLTGVGVRQVESLASGVQVLLSDGRKAVVEKVLVSVGRTLNSDGIGLETAGVETDRRGAVTVNERMETTVPGIYAVGDVTGRQLLAHVASRGGIVAALNACGREASMDYSVVPAAIYTDPEIASVGMREHQALEQNLPIRTGRFHFRALGKSHAAGDISGFAKIIADAGTDRLLGAHIIGPHASDLIHEMAVAMRAGLTAGDIAATIHAHPTFSEVLLEASEDVHGEAIHAPRK